MSRLSIRIVWLPILAALGFAALTWPVWRWLWSEWMSNEYYSFGVLIPPVALVLAFQRFRNDRTLVYQPGKMSFWGLAVLVPALTPVLVLPP